LVHGLYKSYTERPVRKVILLGVENAGKSTLLEGCKAQFGATERVLEPKSIQPTVGLNVGKIFVGGVAVLLWDLGGAKGLRPIWDRYLEQADALVFVLDAADEERFTDARATLLDLVNRPVLEGRPLLVFVNKQDKHALAISSLQVGGMARSSLHRDDDRPLLILPGSALEQSSIREGIEWIVSRVNSIYDQQGGFPTVQRHPRNAINGSSQSRGSEKLEETGKSASSIDATPDADGEETASCAAHGAVDSMTANSETQRQRLPLQQPVPPAER